MMIDQKMLYKLYVIEKQSLRAIAESFGVAYDTIHYWCARYGIPRRSRGSVSGEVSHNWRGGVKITNGYVYAYQPGHPCALKSGYVMWAIIVWEEANGMPFPKGKLPHHKNNIKNDDYPENIEPLTCSEHKRLHALTLPRVNGKFGKSILELKRL